MSIIRKYGAAAFFMTAAVVGAQTSIFTVSHLALVGQESFADPYSILLVSEDPFSSQTVKNLSNYAVEPGRKIQSVQWDPQLSSVVCLKLDPSTPLNAGDTFEVSVIDGKNYLDKNFDAYYMRKKFVARSIETERRNILNSVIPTNGSITIKHQKHTWEPTDGVRITPYFDCMAINGLVSYARMNGEYSERDLAVSDGYLKWHMANMDPVTGYINDWHGSLENIRNTEDFDSTDSYGAFFCISVWRQYMQTKDLKKLQERWDAVKLAIHAVQTTQDKDDHLTLAKPSYPVKYAMDNVEVWQGYVIAAQIARTLGKDAEYKAWSDLAVKVESSVQKELWWNVRGPWRYSVGKDNAGKLFGDWDKYYPDGMANDMTMDMMHFPGDARMKEAWSATRAKYLEDSTPDEGVELHAMRVAMRLEDKAARDMAWMNTLRLHEESYYSFMSGQLLDMLWWERTEAFKVKESVDAGKIDWNKQPYLVFHPVGLRSICFDNFYTARTDNAAVQSDSLYQIRFARVKDSLIVRMESDDNSVLLESGKEGISSLKLVDSKTKKSMEASCMLVADFKVKASVGEAKAAKTKTGYSLEWTLPLDGMENDTLGFNIAVSDAFAAEGAPQVLVLSDPNTKTDSPKYTVRFVK